MIANNQNVDFVNLLPGDAAPWFHQKSTSSENYAFDSAAGRYIVLCFFSSASDAISLAALGEVKKNRGVFDDERVCFFGISCDPADKEKKRVSEDMPGIRFFWDHDGKISKLYGAVPTGAASGKDVLARRFWMVLDPTLRVMKVLPFKPDGSDRYQLFDYLAKLRPPQEFLGFEVPPPILILPNMLDSEFCSRLVKLHEADGGEATGTMREVNGRTVQVLDRAFKTRTDYTVDDPRLKTQLQALVKRRIVPELMKIFAFKATRMERYLVGCYTAEDGGHFRPHRDNTTKGTAHRRFAVSINLNAAFEGGELSFPEYGTRSYKAPPGAAIVFPCALLHAVSKVTSGRRYAFLPFLYDDEAAKIREANNSFLGDGVGSYSASTTSDRK